MSVDGTRDQVLQVMLEYGQAIRGDWSYFDGRTMQGIIETWVEYLDGLETIPDIGIMRDRLNLCLAGGGHWCGSYGYCDEECSCDGWHGLDG